MEKVYYNGMEITLQQDAYIDGTKDNAYYRALGTDNNGNEYNVIWEVVENWEELDDAGDHVREWSKPDRVERV